MKLHRYQLLINMFDTAAGQICNFIRMFVSYCVIYVLTSIGSTVVWTAQKMLSGAW